MNSTTFNFVRPSEVLPGWMAAHRPNEAGSGQLWPDHVPIGGSQQLPGNSAIRDGLDLKAAVRRESGSEPALQMLPGNANCTGNGGLTSDGEKGPIKGGSCFKHVKIISKSSTNSKPVSKQIESAPVMQSGMEIWKRIESELHRRRLNPMWLARKLDVTRQVINGWKKRGVPTRRYEEIAAALNWTLDKLVMDVDGEAPTQSAPADMRPSPALMTPSVNTSATYSPFGLDLAAQFDAIPDDEQRLRAYALVMQIIRMSSAPPSMPLVQQPAAPDRPPTSTPRRDK